MPTAPEIAAVATFALPRRAEPLARWAAKEPVDGSAVGRVADRLRVEISNVRYEIRGGVLRVATVRVRRRLVDVRKHERLEQARALKATRNASDPCEQLHDPEAVLRTVGTDAHVRDLATRNAHRRVTPFFDPLRSRYPCSSSQEDRM